MTPSEAERLVHHYLKLHAFDKWREGWRYGGELRAAHTLGRTYYRDKKIRLSKHLLEQAEEKDILDTILHEVAHVIAGPGAKHGPVWKAHATRLGATPRAATHDVHIEVDKRYEGTCAHGCTFKYARRPSARTMLHGYCPKHRATITWMDKRAGVPLRLSA